MGEDLPAIEETATTLTVRDDYQSPAVAAVGGVVTLFVAAGFAFFAALSLLFALLLPVAFARHLSAGVMQAVFGSVAGAVVLGGVAWWLFRAGGGLVKRSTGPDRSVAQVWHFDRVARTLVVAERHFHAPTQSQRDIPTTTYPLPPAGAVTVGEDDDATWLRVEASSLRLVGVGHYAASLSAMTALANQINRFLAA